MNTWIYPVGNKVYTFKLKDDTELDLNIESFKENLLKNKLPSKFWWHVRNNYTDVKEEDEIYLYATQRNKKYGKYGIIGYAKVVGKRICEEDMENNIKKRKEIELELNVLESKKFVKNPLYLPSGICHIPMSPLGKVSKECKDYILEREA